MDQKQAKAYSYACIASNTVHEGKHPNLENTKARTIMNAVHLSSASFIFAHNR